jgi:hypothetical protein
MSADSEPLPPPNEPVKFESLCLDLFKELWRDPNAQKNGRSGRPQGGVDVFGQKADELMGVQCKQKNNLLWRKITAAELEAEVKKARRFRPPLSEFILATSGLADEKVQQRARELTDAHEGKGLFKVSVWSWRELWHEIYGRPSLLERLGPVYWPRLWEAFSRRPELARLAATLATHQDESAESLVARAGELSEAAASAPQAEAQTQAIIEEVFEASHDGLVANLRSFVGDSRRLADSLMRRTFPLQTVLCGLFRGKSETANSRREKFAVLIDYAQKNLAKGGGEWFVREFNHKLDFPGGVVYSVPAPAMTDEEMEAWQREDRQRRERSREKVKRMHPDWPDYKIEGYLNTFGDYSAEEPDLHSRRILTDSERIKKRLLEAEVLDFWTCRWLVTANQKLTSGERRQSSRKGAQAKRNVRTPPRPSPAGTGALPEGEPHSGSFGPSRRAAS